MRKVACHGRGGVHCAASPFSHFALINLFLAVTIPNAPFGLNNLFRISHPTFDVVAYLMCIIIELDTLILLAINAD